MSVELLSPVGDMDSLIAALDQGADSVYLGAASFSARANAKNFGENALPTAIGEAHARGARAYIALNTLLFDPELDTALELARKLYEFGADALIVQDVGLLRLLKANLPDFPLHASTQMCIHDARGLEFAASLGIERVVLSRELPLSDIQKLAKASPVELEVFVHGALCSAFSGGCLFSSMVGGRSGNRGACAQPCRLPYTISGKKSHILSMKDLCLIDHIDELRDAGVAALKIEGRMRGPDYVATVTRAYRNVLDGAPPAEQHSALESVCHHFGYCTGYLFGDDGLTATERPASWRMPAPPPLKPYRRQIPLSMRLELSAREPCALTVSALGAKATARGAIPEPAKSAPLTADKAQSLLSKLGDTPFELNEFTACIDDGLFLPSSALNALRRDAMGALNAALAKGRPASDARSDILRPSAALKQNGPKTRHTFARALLAQVVSPAQALAAANAGADTLIFRPLDWQNAFDALKRVRDCCDKKLILRLPGVLRMQDWPAVMAVLDKASPLLDGACASNPGQARLLLEMFDTVLAGHELNVTNRESAEYWASKRVRICVSPELTMRRVHDILDACDADLAAYGALELMTLFHCPMRDSGGSKCSVCKDRTGALTDRMNETFPLECERVVGRRLNLLNAHRLDLMRRWPKDARFSPRLLFSGEDAATVSAVTGAYRAVLDGTADMDALSPFGETTGRYYAK